MLRLESFGPLTSLVRRKAVARAASSKESSPSSIVLISHVVSTPCSSSVSFKTACAVCNHTRDTPT